VTGPGSPKAGSPKAAGCSLGTVAPPGPPVRGQVDEDTCMPIPMLDKPLALVTGIRTLLALSPGNGIEGPH